MKSHIRRRYTERDQAKTAVVLKANGGNVKKTGRETGVPPATVRDWKQKWEEDGYPDVEDFELELKDFVESATEVRFLMVEMLREKIERRELTGRDLITGIGILTDKINIMTGMATSRTEHVELALPDPQELAKALATFVGNSVDDAINRNEEIEDADFEEVPKKTLELVKGN